MLESEVRINKLLQDEGARRYIVTRLLLIYPEDLSEAAGRFVQRWIEGRDQLRSNVAPEDEGMPLPATAPSLASDQASTPLLPLFLGAPRPRCAASIPEVSYLALVRWAASPNASMEELAQRHGISATLFYRYLVKAFALMGVARDHRPGGWERRCAEALRLLRAP